MGILIIDPNRSGSKKNRSEPEPKILKYVLGPNVLNPKDHEPKGTNPNLTQKPERSGLAVTVGCRELKR